MLVEPHGSSCCTNPPLESIPTYVNFPEPEFAIG
jgi:hypothetical protein